jgi:hypothetical protein
MTSQGSPYERFRQALLTKNMTVIDAAAAELGRLPLEGALRVLIVMAEKRHPRFAKGSCSLRCSRDARATAEPVRVSLCPRLGRVAA